MRIIPFTSAVRRRTLLASVGAVAVAALLVAQPVAASEIGTINCNPTGQTTTGLTYTEPAALGSAEQVGGAGGTAFAGFAIDQDIVIDPVRNLTYAGYFSGTGVLTIAKRSATGVWTTATPKVSGATVVLQQNLDDSHNSVSLALDQSGTLHVTGATHNKPLLYWRAATAGSIADLTHYPTILNASAEGSATYASFFNDKTGALHLQFRNGMSGAGNGYLYRFDSATRAWSNPTGVFFNGAVERGPGGKFFENTPNNFSAYPSVPVYDATADIYSIAWVWRADSSTAESNSRLSYAWSRNLVTWYPMQTSITNPTTPLTLPLTYASTDTRTIVDDGQAGGFAGTPQIGFDGNHRPVITYLKNNANLDTKLYAARPAAPFDSASSTWRVSDITATPNSTANVNGNPTSTYVSAWSGRNGADAPSLFASSPMKVSAGGTMSVAYTCNGSARRIVFKNTGTTGIAHFVSDGFDTARSIPLSITQRSGAYATYDLATRTVESAPFTVPAGYAAGVSAGTTAHWVMRWESKPYLANAVWPAASTYPAAGTALSLQLVTG